MLQNNQAFSRTEDPRLYSDRTPFVPTTSPVSKTTEPVPRPQLFTYGSTSERIPRPSSSSSSSGATRMATTSSSAHQDSSASIGLEGAAGVDHHSVEQGSNAAAGGLSRGSLPPNESLRNEPRSNGPSGVTGNTFLTRLTRRKRNPDHDDPSSIKQQQHNPPSPATNLSRLKALQNWKLTHMLENKGSVARDHLANERTFLAWLRTSLSLASIGIAITQLFRLPSSTTLTPPPSNGTATTTGSSLTALREMLLIKRDGSDTTPSDLDLIRQLILEQTEQILTLQGQVNDPLKYRHLGKPIGGTFIALALLFLLLGANRYFSVQTALIKEPKSMYPPSRRTVMFAATCVAAIVTATFATILAVR